MKLKKLSSFVMRHAGIIALVGILLGVVGAYYSVQLYKNLRTDIEELLPSTARSGLDLKELTRRLESFDYLAVVIQSKEPQASKKFVDALVQELKKLPPDLVARVEFRIGDEMEYFKKRVGLFLELQDLEKVRSYVRDRVKFEKEFYNPLNIFPVSDKLKKPELDFDGLMQKYQRPGSYDTFPDGYYAKADGSAYAVLVYMAGKHSNIHAAKELHAQMLQIVGKLNPTSFAPDLTVNYSGDVQSFLEEHGALIADLESSTVIVVLLVSFAMLFFFRDIWGTLSLISSLFIATFWTFGISYFVVGYLNANSAFLGSIVIGNGINFGIILLARYLEERKKGRTGVRANFLSIGFTTTATLTAALAAAFSYGSLMLTRFRGFQQFGVIGLIGMVLCWISAVTLLPAFLTLADKYLRKNKAVKHDDKSVTIISHALARFVEKFTKPIVIASIVMTVASIAFLPRISHKLIETDLSRLRNKDSIEKGAGFYDKFLIRIFQHYLSPIVILTDDREQAIRISNALKEKQKQLGKESDIASVQTLSDFVPPQQEEKIILLKEMRTILTPKIIKSLEDKERNYVKDFLTEEALHPFVEKDIPKLILEKFAEKDGTLGRMVVVEPPLSETDDIAWNGKRLISFIHLLRETADSVKPGTPVAGQLPISADMVESITEDGPKATAFALIAVVLLVVILFRDVQTIGFTLFSLFLGLIWMAGIVLAFRLKINFLNFIALPITFGIGVDYGVNVFQRYLLERKKRKDGVIIPVIKQTGGAVMLASCTTVIGYGSLVIASNQAFVSFGTLAVMGEITCITAAVLSLPAYLLYRERKQNK